MAALVIAEHDNLSLKAATLNTVTAALACSPEVDLLVAGSNVAEVAKVATQIAGIRQVIVMDDPTLTDQLAEPMTAALLSVVEGYTHVLAPSSAHGKNILPRLAAKLDVAQVSDITKVVSPDTFERPIYAGNAIATVQSKDAKKVITVRTTNFEPASATGGNAGTTATAVANSSASVQSTFISRELTVSDRPELSAAKIIVSGGRGLGSAEQYHAIIEPLADKLGAALGASRAAVDAGYVPNDYQVGQTGKIVAPELYLAIGISGAIQHLAGMKDSKVIVAINKDPEAPIFGVADYGLVADLFTAVPELTKALG